MGSLYIVCVPAGGAWSLPVARHTAGSSREENRIVKNSSCSSVVCRGAFVLFWIALAGSLWIGARAATPEPKETKGAKAATAAVAAPPCKVDERKKVSFSEEMTILARGTFEDQEESLFDEFYTQDFFPRWTLPEGRSRTPLATDSRLRTDLIRDLRNKLVKAKAGAGGQQVYEHLNKLTLANMSRMSKAPYCPSTRVNAMLMIGELNGLDAVQELVKTVQDDQQSDAVRVAAMVGLIRHASPEAGITDPAMLQTVTLAMIAIAETPVPDGDKADGGNWIRAQAAEVLGLLGSPGFNGAVVKALGTMLRDPKLPLAQRCRAAHALGQLDYSGAVIGAGPYLDALGGLAHDALSFEQKSTPSVRRLKSNFYDILVGLRGVDNEHAGIAKTAADQARRDALVNAIESMNKPLNDGTLSADDLPTAIDDALKALDGLLKAK
jgi:hypothetical protein